MSLPDPMTPDEREDRLPVWARATLSRLRRAVEDARREHEEALLLTDPETTNTIVPRYGGSPDIGLPTGERVRFLMPDVADHVRQYVDVGIVEDGTTVEVRSSTALIVRPTSSNVFRVKLDRW